MGRRNPMRVDEGRKADVCDKNEGTYRNGEGEKGLLSDIGSELRPRTEKRERKSAKILGRVSKN